MKHHKTIIISCFIEKSPQAIPLAASILKEVVCDLENLDVALMDFTIAETIESASRKILESRADSLGCSLYIWNSSFFDALVRRLKELNPELVIYCGGAEATADPELLNRKRLYDYILPGEGEIPFRQLMLYLTGAGPSPEGPILERSHEKDINRIPSPFLSGTLNPSDYDGLLWELSRGCPYNCAFCCESRGVKGVRYYDMNRISAELELFENSGVSQIFVLDPTFNINKDRALALLSLIGEKAPNIHYTFEIRAELLDEETAEAFSRTHCSLQIGLQSGHQKVLERLNRNIDSDLFRDKIALLNKYGAVFGLDLIFGLPGDTVDGFLESLDYALDLIPNHLDIFRLSVFPGTELYYRAGSYGVSWMTEAPYSVVSTDNFSSEDLLKLERLAEAVDLFYNRGKAAPWFLPLVDYLGMKGSEFFLKFLDYLPVGDIDSEEIYTLQAQFVVKTCSSDEEDNGLAAALDLVLYHHLFSQCLYALPEDDEGSFPIDTGKGVFKKSRRLLTGIFSYDMTLYSELGMIEIESFIRQFDREVSYGMFFNIDGEVGAMGLDQSLYMFLQSLDGIRSIGEILSALNKEADELEEFIGFLAETKLIIPVR